MRLYCLHESQTAPLLSSQTDKNQPLQQLLALSLNITQVIRMVFAALHN